MIYAMMATAVAFSIWAAVDFRLEKSTRWFMLLGALGAATLAIVMFFRR